MPNEPAVTLDDVRQAAARLAGVAHLTPILTSRTLDRLASARVYLKCENFQRVGAFKFRGAYNTISQLPADQLARGVAAYSSGNHAQAVALSAQLLGTSAVIVMPEDTPASKVAATRGYGAEVVTYDRYSGDREAIGQALATERGLTLVPPYEHPDVIAGQGTVALEMLEQVGDIDRVGAPAPPGPVLDTLVVPVGGGGLMAGCATVLGAAAPKTHLVGVEPTDGDDTMRSLAAGHRVSIPVPRTISDAQAATVPGELTFSINRQFVDEIALVTDDEVRAAMRLLFDHLKIVAEPTGASALAAVLANRTQFAGQHVGIVISGGNVDSDRFCRLMASQVAAS